ncbi:Hypothetical predicted protein [Pelobates cultripes]|uniref:Uncharacterized protein n=1 Tax=Pelobates cultripes TaxID=61616 RepID=A0AAD1VJB4_PELCU|nr:Hypothetical predicted protein [Pelobates cultripes]
MAVISPTLHSAASRLVYSLQMVPIPHVHGPARQLVLPSLRLKESSDPPGDPWSPTRLSEAVRPTSSTYTDPQIRPSEHYPVPAPTGLP